VADWAQLTVDEKLDAMRTRQLLIGIAAGSVAVAAFGYALYRGTREDTTETRLSNIERDLDNLTAIARLERKEYEAKHGMGPGREYGGVIEYFPNMGWRAP